MRPVPILLSKPLSFPDLKLLNLLGRILLTRKRTCKSGAHSTGELHSQWRTNQRANHCLIKYFFWKSTFSKSGTATRSSNAAHHQLPLADAARALPMACSSPWPSRPSHNTYLGTPRRLATSFVLASSSGIRERPRTLIDSLSCATCG